MVQAHRRQLLCSDTIYNPLITPNTPSWPPLNNAGPSCWVTSLTWPELRLRLPVARLRCRRPSSCAKELSALFSPSPLSDPELSPAPAPQVSHVSQERGEGWGMRETVRGRFSAEVTGVC
eukprot:1548689-Rhodomonas_salina.1